MGKLIGKPLLLIILFVVTLSASGAWVFWREYSQQTVLASGTEHKHRMYVCPMHPQVRQESPGDCPICGMHLELEDNSSGLLMSRMDEHDQVPIVSDNAQSVLGLRTTRVENRALNLRIHTVARVIADSANEQIVTAPTDGWIKKLHVKSAGTRVAAGAALFEFYAPELEQSQRDYIDSLNRRDQLLNGITDMRGQNGEVLGSLARERKRQRDALLRLGIAPTSIDAIEKFRRPLQTLTIVSTRAGRVTDVSAREGAAVGPLVTLYRVLDDTAVQLDIVLTPSQLTALAAPVQAELIRSDETIRIPLSLGRAVFNPDTQSYSLRAALTQQMPVQPGSVLDVDVMGQLQNILAVPREALLDGPSGSFVVAKIDANHFVPRRVTVGIVDRNWVAIQTGLEAGDTVVTDGQFMLDAASTFDRTFADTMVY